MLINNIDISKFNSEVLDINIQNSSITNNNSTLLPEALIPIFLESNKNLNTITVTLKVDSKNKEQYFKDKSNLLSNLLSPSVLFFKDRNLSFKSILTNQSDIASNSQVRGRLKLIFSAYNIQNEVTETMNRVTSKTINVAGNTKIPAVVEITPTSDLVNITITGFSDKPIIANNLKANKKLIIDGESGLVTVDNENFFSNMDMWEFPRLNAGANTITVDKSNLDINIKFKPRYI